MTVDSESTNHHKNQTSGLKEFEIMKKVLVMMMAVLLAAGAVFAADPVELQLTALVDGILEHKLTAGAVDETSWDAAAIVAAREVDLASTDVQNIAFYALRTNVEQELTVSVRAEALAHANGSYYIPYALNVGAKNAAFSGQAGKTELADASLTLDDVAAESMTYLSEQVSIQFDRDYSMIALEGEYAATITFSVTAS